MPYSNTIDPTRGKRFYYDGELNTGLKVYPLDDEGNKTGTIVRIDVDTIRFIKRTINEKGKIKMGACRDHPSPQSLGEMLSEQRKSPQWLSYILPLLEEEGFLKHYKEGRCFWVKRSED